MTPPSPESMLMSASQICEAVLTWANYNGWTGERCGRCGSTANVLAGGPGWICPCGHYNVQCWHGAFLPHDDPTYGPPSFFITHGHDLSLRVFVAHFERHGEHHPRDYFRRATSND